MAAKTTIDLSKFRNLGIIAHIDAGKTTTTEHLLYYAGAKHNLGGVDEGNTETDYDPEEQERGITIYSACVPFSWRDCTINLIDTPGHVDFTAEVERSLRVLDGAVVVFDAQKGVEAQSETVWRQANKYAVPRLVFVNKMDIVGASFEKTLNDVKTRLAANPVPVVVPIGAGSEQDITRTFEAVIDLIAMQALYFDPADQGKTVRAEPIPDNMQDEAKAWREKLFDALTFDDKQDRLTTAYMEGREIDPATVRAVIREQTIARSIQPVLCGSGRMHVGIQPLLDAVTYYLPSPLDRPPVVGKSPKREDKDERRKPDPKEPFAGLVFKYVADTHGGLYYVRIYSGTLKAQSRVFNPGRDVKENIGKLYHTLADPTQRRELPETHAGDIVAVIGPQKAVTGDTLCATQHPSLLERITFAQAVVSRTVEPESSADKQKLTDVLNLLAKEDPTFTWTVDKETGQTLMNGMGTLHLEIKVHRMERDFRLKVRVGKPNVSYRETLKAPARAEGSCERRMPGGGQLFAKITVELEPFDADGAIVVQSDLPDGTLTPLLEAAAARSVRGTLESGQLGYPVMNVKATLVAAAMDEQTSTEAAFELAAAEAVRQAMRDNMVLLEPWMKVTVSVPGEYIGKVSSDVNARRGEVRRSEMDDAGGGQVEGYAPLRN